MLGVEIGEVRHKILHHRHMRQRVNLDGTLDVVHALGAGKRVCAVDIHGAGTANAFTARTAQRQGRVNLVLDIEQTVQNHRTAIVAIDIIGVDARIGVVVRRPAIDTEFGNPLRTVGARPGLALLRARILGKCEFNHCSFP